MPEEINNIRQHHNEVQRKIELVLDLPYQALQDISPLQLLEVLSLMALELEMRLRLDMLEEAIEDEANA